MGYIQSSKASTMLRGSVALMSEADIVVVNGKVVKYRDGDARTCTFWIKDGNVHFPEEVR